MPTQATIRSLHVLSGVAISLACLAQLCATVSFAQSGPRTTAAARALFQEGVACADRADWDCAVQRFERARTLRSSPVIESNYAIALTHVGRLVEASEAYRELSRDTAASPEQRSAATRAIATLADRIGQITIVPAGPVEGVAIAMDGTTVSTSLLGVPVPTDPGDHVVEARREGTIVASAHVHLAAAARTSVTLAIPPPPIEHSVEPPRAPAHGASAPDRVQTVDVETPVPAAPPAHHEIYEEWWFWTIVGVAVVGAGVGIGAGVAESQGTTLPSGSLGTIDGRL